MKPSQISFANGEDDMISSKPHPGQVALLKLAATIAFFLVSGCATSPTHESPADHRSGADHLESSTEAASIRKAAVPLPRIMLMIDEKSLGTIPTSEVEAMGVGILTGLGYTVVDQDTVKANIKKDQQMLLMSGDTRGAKAMALQFGADVIVLGEAVAKPSARRIADTNLRAYQAIVTLRAVRTDNSATIASASETETVAALEDVSGSSQALKKAARKSFEILAPKIESAWIASGGASAEPSGQPITLTVGGVDKTWKLKAVRDSLREMSRNVSNIIQRSYTSGVAVFEVTSSLPAEELGEMLLVNPPEGIKYQILEIQSGKISIRAVPVEGM